MQHGQVANHVRGGPPDGRVRGLRVDNAARPPDDKVDTEHEHLDQTERVQRRDGVERRVVERTVRLVDQLVLAARRRAEQRDGHAQQAPDGGAFDTLALRDEARAHEAGKGEQPPPVDGGPRDAERGLGDAEADPVNDELTAVSDLSEKR